MTFQPWILWGVYQTVGSTHGFKGAMTFQPWILLQTPQISRTTRSFKGAMTFQPWIRDSIRSRLTPLTQLQRSHDLSAMDTSHNVRVIYQTVGLQRSHDLSAMDTRTDERFR